MLSWRARVLPRLVEQCVERIRLEQAALDVEDRVVPVGFVQPYDGLAGRAGDGEFHLVPIAIDLGRGNDRTDLDAAEAAEALEAISDLLGLIRELGRIAQVLVAAAAAAAEVRARRLHAIRGRRFDRLDRAPAEAGPGFDQPDPKPVARNSTTHEHHVSVDPAHALAAEREVVNSQRESVSALWTAHGGHTINVRRIEVNLARAYMLCAAARARYDVR